MLAHAPELSLSLVDYLSSTDLSHLSLTNRTLCVLLRPRLYRDISLTTATPFIEGEETEVNKRIKADVASLLSGDEKRFRLVKKLVLTGCEWTASEEGLDRLEELLSRLEIEEVEFLHCAPFPDEIIELRWEPLWRVFEAQKTTLTSLTIIGSARRLSVSGTPALEPRLTNSKVPAKLFMQRIPRGLTSLSLSSIDLVEEEASAPEPFPVEIFEGLESLELADLDPNLMWNVKESYEEYKMVAAPSSPSLKHLSLNLCVEIHVSWPTPFPYIDFDDLIHILWTFGSPEMETLKIGSTPRIPHRTFRIIGPRPARRTTEVGAAPFLACSIASVFPHLTDLTFMLNPRTTGWAEESGPGNIATSFKTLDRLRHLTTNVVLADEPTPADKAVEFSRPPHFCTITDFSDILPSMCAISNVRLGRVPRDCYDPDMQASLVGVHSVLHHCEDGKTVWKHHVG